MGLAAELGYRIASRMVVGRPPPVAASAPERDDARDDASGTRDADSRVAWRDRVLRRHFLDSFDAATIVGKDVLDFGCGAEGGLCYALAGLGVRSIAGLDISEPAVAAARARAEGMDLAVRPSFHCSRSPAAIDLPDATFDVVICFDVLEHVSGYATVIPEWRRILRPGGRVLIWWMPYLHPYGHHLKEYVPIPWAHVLLSERTLLRICSRIVRTPGFSPPFWDLDAAGNRIDRFAGVDRTDYLNKLSIERFEAVCRDAGFGFARREFRPFSGPAPVRLASRLGTLVPGLRNLVSAAAIYELVTPTACGARP